MPQGCYNLAESILQVSRIESGKFSLNIQKDVDIHSLILQVIEDIEKKYMYTHKAKKVSIVFMPYYEREERRQKKRKDGENTIKHRITDTMINEIRKLMMKIKLTYTSFVCKL